MLTPSINQTETEMKLVYWIADCLDDHPCYSLRAKTRREVTEKRAQYGAERYGKPRKVETQYRDAFHLVYLTLSEGGIEGIRDEG